jgi:hypothetical protein
MLEVLAFGTLGLLVGCLIGLTSQSVVAGFLPLLFAFAGGSVFYFLERLNAPRQRRALIALTAMCTLCLVGVIAAILATEHQIFSPPVPTSGRPRLEDRKYLRSSTSSVVESIDRRVQNNQLSKETAYDELVQELRRQ